MPDDSVSRYGPGDDALYQGFHTYATGDLYDSNDGSERWPDNWASSSLPDQDGQDVESEEPPTRRDYWLPLLWTIVWYAVPALVLVLRALVLPAKSEQTRAGALADLTAYSPWWLLALVTGLILALVLRWASDTWRPATIGFCAAVVSGGAITVLYRIW
jgi:ABC-type sugar transport system permease subunit